MVLAIKKLIASGQLPPEVLKTPVAAISVGIIDGVPLLDLCYEEDVRAEVDANIVMNSEGAFIEVQGTAEGEPFSRNMLESLLALAGNGIQQLLKSQQEILS
jgi:ribonuclease PH